MANPITKITLPDGVKDITAEFLRNSTPCKGSITEEPGFVNQNGEREGAQWIHSTFGGNIELLGEILGKLNPDYRWNGKCWDLKTTSSSVENTIEGLLRRGFAQIESNSGGILLDFSKSSLSFEDGERLVARLSAKRAKREVYVILKKNNDFLVLRTNKTAEA